MPRIPRPPVPRLLLALMLCSLLLACTNGAGPTDTRVYDTLIIGGTVYDGSGGAGQRQDIGIRGDRIASIGDLSDATARQRIDAREMAVSPGFINMLSWAVQSLREDGRGISDISQGVTLEVFGEGWSMGPVPPTGLDSSTARDLNLQAGEFPPWRSLGEYLQQLEDRGVAPNVASFVGATTLRIHEIGMQNRAPSAQELARMQELARQAMREGAMGLGSSLIYPPAFFASTEELIALAQAVAEYDGLYISHLRSEGKRLPQAIEELLRIAREADVRAEIYHLKVAGRDNWDSFDRVIAQIEAARAAGIDVGANIYTYPAGATGLSASLPPWTGEGGIDARVARLVDPLLRERILAEMRAQQDAWENLLLAAGAEGVLLSGFDKPALAHYAGRTLADVAKERKQSPEETVLDLIVEDHSRVDAIYFLMSEENVARKMALPWVSFGSDAGTYSAAGDDLSKVVHPRAYGTFARVLGRYSRQEQRLSLSDAVRRLSGLPASRLGLKQRGLLREGNFADIVVFDPRTVGDRASFAAPHQLASGVGQVMVNGELVWADGAATGRLPGRFVKGPGYQARRSAP
ncbi:MAG: N-acyl-D-amino-acid deacylase [Halieaceae bacterium]|jgi:N-acyl-D-amino-acid deacylase